MESGQSSASDAPATLEDCLEKAEARRQAGNTKFRTGDVPAARDEYEEALKLLRKDKFGEAEEDLAKRVEACKTPAQLNLALCCLKAEPPDAHRALELCEEVLYVEPENAKAYFRKGRALVELGEYLQAEYEFKEAVKLAPGDLQIRKDLEALRIHMRKEREQEKRAYGNVFSHQDAGFMSEGRTQALQMERPSTANSTQYDFISDPKENPFLRPEVQQPEQQALKLLEVGRLEQAIWAWEASIQQSVSQQDCDWALHFSSWLGLGRLYMDLNMDKVALRCINKAAGFDSSDVPPVTQRHALLLRAVCLLNESESDTLAEVSACLDQWLDASGAGVAPGEGVEALEQRMSLWRQAAGATSVADAAVAQGLLHLLHGREEALQAFADALTAAVDEGACFGASSRYAVRWNMLGAVFANRGHYTQALVVYGEALKLQPHYPRALTNRGIALKACEDSEGAAAAYTTALEIVPEWASDLLWKLVEQATQDMTEKDVADAVEQRSLVGLQQAFGAVAPAAEPQQPVAEVLGQLGLSV